MTCQASVLGNASAPSGLPLGEIQGGMAMDTSLRSASRIFANRFLVAAVAILTFAACAGVIGIASFLLTGLSPAANPVDAPSPALDNPGPSLAFEANQGQARQDVDFVARGPGYGLMLRAGQALLAVEQPSDTEYRESGAPAVIGEDGESMGVQRTSIVRLDLIGSDSDAKAIGLEPLPGTSNYFVGSDRELWLTGVPHFGRVRYEAVYPGIDLEYYGTEGQLEYDLVVAPGADPEQIRLRLEGGADLHLDAEGELVLATEAGDFLMKVPVIYQEVEDQRRPVAGKYVLHEDGRVGFELGAYDTDRPLVIDPLFEFLRYLGGASADRAYAVAVDPAGYIYLAGKTFSADFPTSAALDGELGGPHDAFVTKLSPDGKSVVYSTYLGGSGFDQANGIAVDRRGVAYVVGETGSGNFPTQNSWQDSLGGFVDAFVSRIWVDGSVLQFSTYLGGAELDAANAVALDDQGNAYLVGMSKSSDFPTKSALRSSLAGGANQDAVVAKVNFGGGLEFSTYWGGTADEDAEGLALDSSNNVYVTGWTLSTDFPTLGAVQTSHGDAGTSMDAWVSELNASGSTLMYSTFLGGGDEDRGRGIAVDQSANAYVAGYTRSTDFPTASSFQTQLLDNVDAFLAKLSGAGTTLVYSTFLGGGSSDYGAAVAVDASGSACIVGQTSSTNFPTLDAVQEAASPYTDAFVSRFRPAGSSLLFSTYVGGSDKDIAHGVALDADGSVYVVGETESSDFQTPLASYGTVSGIDAFIARLSTPMDFWIAAAGRWGPAE